MGIAIFRMACELGKLMAYMSPYEELNVKRKCQAKQLKYFKNKKYLDKKHKKEQRRKLSQSSVNEYLKLFRNHTNCSDLSKYKNNSNGD